MAKQIKLIPLKVAARRRKRSIPYIRALADAEVIDSVRCGIWRGLYPHSLDQIREYEEQREAARKAERAAPLP